MLLPALPAVVLLQEQDILGTATRASDAIGPAPRYHVFPAIDGIGEVYDGFLKGGGFLFHALILADFGYLSSK